MDVRPAPGTGGGAEVPTCFRHPERETYLSCVRCGRPACPECLRSAPVGQQCVECVKEGNRGVRTPAAMFGGRAGSGALVTYTLVGLNVLFYVLVPPYQQALGASGAVFGLFGAWFVVSRRMQVDTRAIVILIVINLVIGFVVPNIAWQDHIGGLLTGGLLTAAYAYAPRQHRALVQAGATAAIVVLLAAAVIARNSQLAASALG